MNISYKFKDQKISLIFLAKPGNYTSHDHSLVYIGPVNVEEKLLTGRGSASCVIGEANLLLSAFLKAHNEGILADPLLGFTDTCNGNINSLLKYCKEYDITHVVGVRSFATTPFLIESAPLIKKNAENIAQRLRPEIKEGFKEAISTSLGKLSLHNILFNSNNKTSRKVEAIEDGEPTTNFNFYNNK